jgi:hypothetical protein
VYYLGPLVGCLLASFCTGYLIHLSHAQSLSDYLRVGLTVGIGYGAAITTVNAIAPNMPRAGLYAAVVGSYHFVGLTLCAAVLYLLS